MKKLLLFFLLTFPLATFAQEEYSLSLFEKYAGEAAYDQSGNDVQPAGDVNNDGYADFLVGSLYNNTAAAAAYLIYGSADELSGASLSTAVKFSGEASYDWAGSKLTSAGDVNNDGYDDILIGADGNDPANAGAAYLIYGQAGLLTSASLTTAVKFSGTEDGELAGCDVASAGDVNADGYDDILVGAFNNGPMNAGAAYLIYGQASLLTSASLSTGVQFTGEGDFDFAGYAVSSAGDVNNDGYDDFLIGAYENSDIYTEAGATYLIYGQAVHLINASLSTAVQFSGEADEDYSGMAVSAAGDVNHDGYADFLIGAASNNSSFSDSGAAYLIYGQADIFIDSSLSTAVKFSGEETSGNAGISLSGAGDVNNDGYDDFVVGATGEDTNTGAIYLIFGSATELSSNLLSSSDIIRFNGEGAFDNAGNAVANAGDINNDEFDELLIGASYNNDGSNTDAGAAYLGYLYIDEDGDGAAGDTGLLSGTDCNDSDATVYKNQTYYQDLDGDGLGNASVTTSICSSAPPAGYVADNTDTNDAVKDISTIIAGDNGDITIIYVNNDTSVIDVFNYSGTDPATLQQYQDNYYLALHPKAKKLALINVNTLTVLSRKTLSKKSFPTNSLKTYTLRNKKWAVVTAKNKKGKVKLSLVKILLTQEKLGKKIAASLINKKIKPAKTKRNHNTILLRSKNNKIINKYLLTKKINLREI
ncbi:MAG: integrin alpha [Patescibacteria group bacterium]|jgi:hypothetical protein